METKDNCGVRDGSKLLQKQTRGIVDHGPWNAEKRAAVKFLTVRTLSLAKVSGKLADNEWDSCNSPVRSGKWRPPWASRHNGESCNMHEMMYRARSIRGEEQLSLIKVN